MRSALRRIDVIDKTVSILCVGIVVLHGDFHSDSVFFSFTVNNVRIQRLLAPVQICYELPDTAFIVKSFFFLGIFSCICENDLQAFCQKSHLPEALFQDVVIKNCFLENLFIRKKIHPGSRHFRITVSHDFKRIHGVSSLISLLIFLAFMTDRNHQPFRKSVYNRSSHSVEAAGNFISPAAEFAAGVENSKYNFNCGDSRLMVDPNGNSSSVIYNCNRIVRIDRYMNFCTVSRQRFIY